jgi:hypothetical protein
MLLQHASGPLHISGEARRELEADPVRFPGASTRIEEDRHGHEKIAL